MKKVAVALLGILAISSVRASELSVVAHGFSHHLDNHNFNERNYGGAVRYEHNDWAMQIGAYRNSINKDSVYAGIDWSPFVYKSDSCLKLEAGAYYGVASGYKFAVTPVVGVQAAVKCENVFVRVRAMPDPYYNAKAVGAIEVGLVIKRF
jgi:hypothetical protein